MKQHSVSEKIKFSTLNFQLSTFLLIAVLFALPLKAQVTIGKDSIPHEFSVLELSTDILKGGLRLPQLSTTQREALLNTHNDSIDAQGLVIYNIDTNCLEFWANGKWINLCEATPFDPSTFALGTGTWTGRTCFDVALSNSGYACGNLAGRTWKADFNDPAINVQTYTFTPTSQISKLQFVYVESSTGLIVQNLDYDKAYETTLNNAGPFTVTLTYKQSLNNSAKGLTNANPLTVKIYAIYNDKPDGSGTKTVSELTANIKDCNCCGAMTSSGWLNIMCHNLGANYSLDPYEFIQGNPNGDGTDGTLGAMYQWGRQTDGHQFRNSSVSSTQNDTPIPNVFMAGNTDWRVNTNDNLWMDSQKTASDPCPTGWRIPSSAQWQTIISSNTWTWIQGKGCKIGDSLFLPAAGLRDWHTPSTIGSVGDDASYWSTTTSPTVLSNPLSAYHYSYDMYFYYSSPNVSYSTTEDTDRAHGVSVRCIANSGTEPTP